MIIEYEYNLPFYCQYYSNFSRVNYVVRSHSNPSSICYFTTTTFVDDGTVVASYDAAKPIVHTYSVYTFEQSQSSDFLRCY